MHDETIILAGRAWAVPLLAPRQNRIVVPALLKLPANPLDDYAALLDIVFAALTRAHPQLAREDFEDWPIATYELIAALPVISRQTGLLIPRRARDEASLDRLGMRNPHAEPAEAPDWDAIIAQFCNFLPGTTPDYWEDALTVPRLEAMNEEWRLHPPVATLLAGYLGYRPQPRNLDALEELMRLFPDGRLKLN